jgi:hypothetical protein
MERQRPDCLQGLTHLRARRNRAAAVQWHQVSLAATELSRSSTCIMIRLEGANRDLRNFGLEVRDEPFDAMLRESQDQGTHTRTRRIHLINPQTNSFTTRLLYMNRALYSPIAGLLASRRQFPPTGKESR